MTTFQLSKTDSEAIYLGNCKSLLVHDFKALQPRELFSMITTPMPSNKLKPVVMVARVRQIRIYAFPSSIGYRYLIDFIFPESYVTTLQ